VRVLLDTQAFLWYLLDDARLSKKAEAAISDENNRVLVSPASYWEIAIKISLGKYQLPEPFDIFMEREIAVNDFTVLAILVRHAAVVTELPFHHRDPFDRLIIAQALSEKIAVVSSDLIFDQYGVGRIW
jgi:PIN domain nuclease of toxin-antitoxin system